VLKRIYIRGYKSLEDTEIKFHDPLTVIIGANASGKSNLFDALALCSRLVSYPSLLDAFTAHRGAIIEAFSINESGLEDLYSKPTISTAFTLDIELSSEVINQIEKEFLEVYPNLGDELASINPHNYIPRKTSNLINERNLRYSLEIEMSTQDGKLWVSNEELIAIDEFGNVKENVPPFLGKVQEEPPIYSLRSEMFSRVERKVHGFLSRTVLSSLPDLENHTHAMAVRNEISSWRFYSLEPKLMRERNSVEEVLALPSDGVKLTAYYNSLKFQKPRQFHQIQRELRMLVPNIQEFDISRTKDGFVELKIKENNISYVSRVISEGTLRVLGILALTNPIALTPLIAIEEPENGIHSHRLARIANHLIHTAHRRNRKMQILITTHSPFFAGLFELNQIIVSIREDRQTRFIPLSEAGIMPFESDNGYISEGDDLKPSMLYERIIRGDYGG